MGSPADEYDSKYALYLKFLINIVDNVEESNFLYLYKRLFDKEFYSILPADVNREKDGLALRDKFVKNLGGNRPWEDLVPNGPCRVLEMMIALAIRVENEVSDHKKRDRTKTWFKMMIFNLGLDKYYDAVFYKLAEFEKIDQILDDFIDRKYDFSGYGGLWPLENPKNDQRKVEIWYQFFNYFEEKGLGEEYLVK